MRALKAHADREHAKNLLRFFKTRAGDYGEGDQFLGLRVPQIRDAAKQFRALPIDEIETLLESEQHEARMLALIVMTHQYARGDAPTRNALFDLYLRRTDRINNWDLVDTSAPQIVGAHLVDGDRAILTRLARSKSIWERRISILATQWLIRLGQFDDTLRIAAMLLNDKHDLIHKAVGWMLREVGKRDLAAETRFLDKHARDMPRTMLRYAIERFPAALRAKYMATSARPSTR